MPGQNLKTIGGSFSVINSPTLSEKNFPSLETVGDDLHLAASGFSRLPPKLTHIGGNIYLAFNAPKTLVDDCVTKKTAGIVKGEVYFVGGQVTTADDGNVVYQQIIPVSAVKI